MADENVILPWPSRERLGPAQQSRAIDAEPGARTKWKAFAFGLAPQLALLLIGVSSWAYGVSHIRPSAIGGYGLLASANHCLVIGFALLLAGFVVELCRRAPRTLVLAIALVSLIVAIHATVPLVFGAPEYAWVYKHLGIVAVFQQYGHVTDPTNIYQEWPVFFAATAGLSSLAHVSAMSLATWAPLAFELADALLLFAIFRLLAKDRRIPWLALLLYEGLISWVGQDYLSPQGFAYLLWLGMALVILRWLRPAGPESPPRGRLAHLRATLVAGLPRAPETSPAMRRTAVLLVAGIYCVIVAAHQLTPYMALAGVGALTVLDLVRPRWLVLLLALIAGAYLVPRYNLIAHQFGGLFSGGSPLQNAAGKTTPNPSGGARISGDAVDALVAAMWLSTLAVVALRRVRRVPLVITAPLAFSPFAILAVQSYGGEAIYRVYMFSAPWCALLIAGALAEMRLRLRLRRPLVAAVCFATLFAGLQGLYGPALVNAFTPSEVNASLWLYRHVPRGSLIALPGLAFPTLESADSQDYDVQVMPADPQIGADWLNEADVSQVSRWIRSLHHNSAYVVVSRSMTYWASYYGAPTGYAQLTRQLPMLFDASVVYRNGDTTIYLLSI